MQDETLPRNESDAARLKRLYEMSAVEGHTGGVDTNEYYAAQDLLDLYEKHRRGDKGAILEAIYHCLRAHLPVPVWCEKAYLDGFERVAKGDEMSWDGAFGAPYPKGTHQHTIETRAKSARVWARVLELHDQGRPIDNQLFDQIGREFGVGGKSKAQNLYTGFREALKNSRLGRFFAETKEAFKSPED